MQWQLTWPMDLAMAVRLALPATSFCFLKLHTPSTDCEHPICNSNRGIYTHLSYLTRPYLNAALQAALLWPSPPRHRLSTTDGVEAVACILDWLPG